MYLSIQTLQDQCVSETFSTEIYIKPSGFEMRENPHFQYDRKPQYVSDEIFKVIILDNDYNTYQEVIDICMEALNISFEEGMKIALAVDNNGFAEVLHAPKNEAEKTANVIRKIGIEVQVIPVS